MLIFLPLVQKVWMNGFASAMIKMRGDGVIVSLFLIEKMMMRKEASMASLHILRRRKSLKQISREHP